MNRTVATFGFGLLAVATGASAQVVFDNGAPNFNSGNEMTAWVQADDFILAQQEVVDCASFNILTFGGLGGWNGVDLDYQILGDAGGLPDSTNVLASGLGVGVVNTYLGAPQGFDSYNVDFMFGGGAAALPGGTPLWFAVHLSNAFNRLDVYFGGTSAGGGFLAAEDAGGAGVWFSNGQEKSFQIGCIPTPGAAALLGLGGLVAVRRRRA